MARRKVQRILNASEKFVGVEPHFIADKELSKLELITNLNWYNAERDAKHAKKYLLDYLKAKGTDKHTVAAVDSAWRDADCYTVGYLCRMQSRGAKLAQFDKDSFDFLLEGFLAAAGDHLAAKKAEKVTPVKVVSVQDRITNQANNVIGEIEVALDNRDYKYDVVKLVADRGMKGPHLARIISWLEDQAKEFGKISRSKDEQIKEAYSNYSKAELKKVINFFNNAVAECTHIKAVVKAQRKPRAKKIKSAAEVAAKVTYLQKDDKLKIVSIAPESVVGALQLWVFNIKTRKLGVFHASDDSGLQIKGTTIKNYDESKSVAKTVRKPEEKLPELMKAGKVALRHFLDEIRAKDSVLKGRLGKDTLLLRTVK